MSIDERYAVTHNETAEKLNGRLAMLGVIAAIGAYDRSADPRHLVNLRGS